MSATGPVDTDVETAVTEGFLTAPMEFQVSLKPRWPEKKEILRKEFKQADAFLSQYDQKLASFKAPCFVMKVRIGTC